MTEDVDQLKSQHHDLESAIDAELARPSPDDLRLNELKRQKLRLKDEILRLDPTEA
ncbi:MAG: YdcH family protein [Alphaproteobacteria bacterium]